MKILADYHTHTIYSHGKGTIEDNVKVAISKGIETLGISDHSYGHLTYGVKRDDIFKIPALIRQFNPSYTFYLRHYYLDDTDTVLFAVPKMEKLCIR